MDRVYRYGVLVPHRVPGAEKRNALLLGPRTLGIEVTERELAARCGLGNVDPQHGPTSAPGMAAIEACLELRSLPRPGAMLVTIRPDMDAFGSMAVLTMRAANVTITRAMRARIALVAARDAFRRGPWPGPRSLPSAPAAWRAAHTQCEWRSCDLGAIAAAVADHARSAVDRVALAEAWLRADEDQWARRARVSLAPYAALTARHAAAAARALAEGRIRIDHAAGGQIAVIHGSTEGALDLGYRLAPVVVALDEAFRFCRGAPHRRFTISQYAEGRVRMALVVRALNAREPGWGGSPTMVGSPQGVGSKLELADVVDIVAQDLSA